MNSVCERERIPFSVQAASSVSHDETALSSKPDATLGTKPRSWTQSQKWFLVFFFFSIFLSCFLVSSCQVGDCHGEATPLGLCQEPLVPSGYMTKTVFEAEAHPWQHRGFGTTAHPFGPWGPGGTSVAYLLG